MRLLTSLLLVLCLTSCFSGDLRPSAGRISDSNRKIYSDNNDIVLLPTEDFPYETAVRLEKILAADTGLKVRAMLPLGIRDWMPYEGGQQYDPEALKNLALPAVEQLRKSYGGTLYILMTSRDLNEIGGNLRFLFAAHFPLRKISVVSVARMTYGDADKPANEALVEERLRKMLLRTIGLQYYNLPRSADPHDTMFSPLMSLDGLDGMNVSIPNWHSLLRPASSP